MNQIEVAGVFDVPLLMLTADAIGAFSDGGFRQTDENGLGHSNVGTIDFDLNRHGIDSQERKCVEFDKHKSNHCTRKGAEPQSLKGDKIKMRHFNISNLFAEMGMILSS